MEKQKIEPQIITLDDGKFKAIRFCEEPNADKGYNGYYPNYVFHYHYWELTEEEPINPQSLVMFDAIHLGPYSVIALDPSASSRIREEHRRNKELNFPLKDHKNSLEVLPDLHKSLFNDAIISAKKVQSQYLMVDSKLKFDAISNIKEAWTLDAVVKFYSRTD